MTQYDPLTSAPPGHGLAHVSSYWAATADDPPPDDGALNGDTEVEVAIIGGGYTGLSCAYELSRRYGIRAAVLEAQRPGWGCSGRNGGFARPAIGRLSFGASLERYGRNTARRIFRQALSALDHVRTLIRDGGIACDALEVGHLKIAHRASRAAGLEREAELLRREFDYGAEYLSGERVRSDHIGGPQSHGALRYPDAIAVHPLKLAWGVLRMARAAGARVHSATPVMSWSKTAREHVLLTPHGRVRARNVVLATNGYTPESLHDCIRATTLPVLSHIIVTRPMTAREISLSRFHTRHVLTDTRNLLYYWRRLADDRILFGGRGRIVETSAGQIAQREFLLDELKAKLEGVEELTVDYDWWGWVCLTADFLPHVHQAPEDSSIHYAIGYQGSGVSYALYAGLLLASRIANDVQDEPIPSTSTPLPRFRLPALRRWGQRAAYQWYRYADNRN
jgi:gamma-glutamylputrescine oxidase